MLICKINPLKPEKDIISKAVKILRQGGVVVFPTETAYGLAADFLNSQAIRKIFQIKHRPEDKKLTLIASDLKMAEQYFYLNKREKKLAKKYWPGPLTLILKIKIFPSFIKGGRGRIYQGQKSPSIPLLQRGKLITEEAGVRISSNKIARKLCQKLGRPITATSANLSGQPACYSAKDIIGQLTKQKHQPDLILDAGKLPRRRVSTIAKIEKNKIKIIREGGIEINSKLQAQMSN